MRVPQPLLMEACPSCRSSDPLEIVYGPPSTEMFDSAFAGLIALGGSEVTDESAAFRCRRPGCQAEWGRWGDLFD